MAPGKACTAAQMAASIEKMRRERKGPSMKDKIQVSKFLAGALLGGLCLLAFLGTAKVHDLHQVLPSTSAAPTVVLDTVSSSAALAFGQQTQFVFACSGSYGTAAPVTITAIYR
jgi:hypothetical protein